MSKVINEHISSTEYLAFLRKRQMSQEAVGRLEMVYQLVVSTWETPEDWFSAEAKTLPRLLGYSTDDYWMTWGLLRGVPLPTAWIARTNFRSAKQFLDAAGAVDVGLMVQRLNSVYESPRTSRAALPAIVKCLLFTGKRRLTDLAPKDVERAEVNGVVSSNSATTIFTAIYLMSGDNVVPPKKRTPRKFRSGLNSEGAPESFKQICDEWIIAITRARSIGDEHYKREKAKNLEYFLTWWSKRNPERSVTLLGFTRQDWLAWVEHVIGNKKWSIVTKQKYAAAVKQFLEWVCAEYPHLMPGHFQYGSEDYTILTKMPKNRRHRTFATREQGDRLIRHLLEEYQPTTVRDTMLWAACIFQAVTGARAGEVQHLGYDAFYWSETDRCYKAIIYRIDKMGKSWRPLLLAREGYEALMRVKPLRELQGLQKRPDQRASESYVHLFEHGSRLVVNDRTISNFMAERMLRIGLVDKDNNPLDGTSHSWRHRFARRIFEISPGDIKVVQHLLGHAVPTMSYEYLTEDEAKRNAALRNEVLSAKLVGPAKEKILYLLEQTKEITEFRLIQASMKRAANLKEVLSGMYNLGYGRCISPCNHYRSCAACGNFLAGEEHIPSLLNEFELAVASASVKIDDHGGGLEIALLDPFTRKDLLAATALREYLEALGADREVITSFLRGERGKA